MTILVKSLQITDETPIELCKADRAVQHLAGTSRRQTVGLFDRGCVRLNGRPCAAPFQRLSVGDTIEVRFDPAQRYAAMKKPPRHLGFDLLFEDEHLIVVNKPAQCLTVPAPSRSRNTLIQRVSAYLTNVNRRRTVRVHAVHRLDGGVSGVLVFAKTVEAHRPLRRQFELHQPQREYWAIVAGIPSKSRGTLRSFLATNESLKRYSTPSPQLGELAITHYEVERKLDDSALVRVRLETGRRNQIRVQFAEAGHPVLGDPRYEPQRARHPRWQSRRLALHASLLAFEHPVTGQACRHEVTLPPEFHQFLGTWTP